MAGGDVVLHGLVHATARASLRTRAGLVGVTRTWCQLSDQTLGIVTGGVQKSTSAKVAIKHVELKRGDIKPVLHEILVLRGLSHGNIIRVVDCFVTSRDGMVVMDFGGRDLRAYRKGVLNGKGVPMGKVCSISSQVLLGVEYIHSRSIIHADLKSCNILICDSGHVRICDFGNAIATTCKESVMKFRWCKTKVCSLAQFIIELQRFC